MNIDRPLTGASTISQRTTVTLGIAAFLAICSTLVTATWQLNVWLNEQTSALERNEQKLDALREQITSLRRDTWTIHDMNTWAGRMRWENRAQQIAIPEPRDWRDYRFTASTDSSSSSPPRRP